MTRNKIEWDLEKSPYTFETLDLVFYFSSQYYLDRFKNEYEHSKNELIAKIKKLLPNADIFESAIAIRIYKNIEKRGFYVFDNFMNDAIDPKSIQWIVDMNWARLGERSDG